MRLSLLLFFVLPLTLAQMVQLWPVAAETNICRDSSGNFYSTTGPGAPTWFNYGGCGTWKEYNIEGYKYVVVEMWGDGCPSCPTCLLSTISAEITLTGPYASVTKIINRGKHCKSLEPPVYVLIENRGYGRLKIRDLEMVRGFYARVWGSSTRPKLKGEVYKFEELKGTVQKSVQKRRVRSSMERKVWEWWGRKTLFEVLVDYVGRVMEQIARILSSIGLEK